MLLRTLESSLLGNLLTSKRSQIPGREVVCTGESTTRGDEGKVKPDQVFLMQPHLLLMLKHKTIIKTSLILMVFIQETIYLQQRMEHT